VARERLPEGSHGAPTERHLLESSGRSLEGIEVQNVGHGLADTQGRQEGAWAKRDTAVWEQFDVSVIPCDSS